MVGKKKRPQPKQRVWQDIVPANITPNSKPKKPTKSFEIKIHLPHFSSFIWLKKIKTKLSRISKRTWIVCVAAVLVVVVGLVVYFQITNPTSNIFSHGNPSDNVETDFSGVETGGKSPDFKTITPSGADVSSFGGWVRASPADRNPAFSYTDIIGGSTIKVIQQPLPEAFLKDTAEQVKKLATNFNANEKITVGGTSVYIGAREEGPQSVIYTKNDLLILITSNTKISNDAWAEYINKLK